MTDKEIIKALECCGDEEELHWCTECPYYDKENDFCQEDLHRDALDLISRQQAEIEELKKVVIDDYASEYDSKIRAEAIKEFAERLKEKYPWKGDYLYSTRRTVENIDNLVKKMVGEQE